MIVEVKLAINISNLKIMGSLGKCLPFSFSHGAEVTGIERARIVFALEDEEILSFLDEFKRFTAMRALKMCCLGVVVFQVKKAGTNLALILPSPTGVVIKIGVRSTTFRASESARHKGFTVLVRLNGVKGFAMNALIINQKLAVIEFFRDLDDG